MLFFLLKEILEKSFIIFFLFASKHPNKKPDNKLYNIMPLLRARYAHDPCRLHCNVIQHERKNIMKICKKYHLQFFYDFSG